MADKKIDDLVFGVKIEGEGIKKGAEEIKRGTKKINKGVKKSTKAFGNFNSTIKTVGKSIAGVFAARALFNFFKSATQQSIAFEREMARINTVTQLSREELKGLGDELLDLSKTLPVSLAELQSGLFDVASAGIEASKQLDFLTASVAFAKVGAFDTATAVKGLTAVIKGFGTDLGDTEKILNLFLQTNVKGQTTLGELATAVQGVSGLARNAGVSMEEFFAILATGTGVTGNAAQVATQLKGAINALAAPTIESSKRFKELGIDVGKSAIQEKGLVAVAKEVFDAVDGDAEALRRLIPEVEASTLVIALATTQNEKFNENLKENKGELNLVQEQFREYARTADGQSEIIKNAWDRITLAVGNLSKKLAVFFVLLTKNPLGGIKQVGASVESFIAKAKFQVADLETNIVKKFAPNSRLAKALEKASGKLAIDFNEASKKAQGGLDELLTGEAVEQLDQALKGLKEEGGEVGDSLVQGAKKTEKAFDGAVGTIKEAEDSIDDLAKSYDKWNKGIENTEKRLESLRDKNKKFLGDIRREIEDVTNSVTELQNSFTDERVGARSDFLKGLADDIVRLTDERKNLEEQTNITDSEKDTLDRIKREEQTARKALVERTVSATAGNRIFNDLLLEAEERASRDAVQVKIDQHNDEERIRRENFEKEKELLEERQGILEAIEAGEEVRLEEITDFRNKQFAQELLAKQEQIDAEIALVEQEQIAIQNAWIAGAQAVEAINDQLIARLDEKYRALAERIQSALSSASGAGGGGEATAGFQAGGFTPSGPSNKVAGVVHGGEWVAKASFVNGNKKLISSLDAMQRKGFQGGGNVSNKNVSFSPVVHHKVGLRSVMREARYHLR